MKFLGVFVLLLMVVYTKTKKIDEWKCAQEQIAKLQSSVAKLERSKCLDNAEQFLQCFDTETKDYQMGISTGHGGRFFVDSSERKIGRNVIIEYGINPMAFSLGRYTMLKGDVNGFVLLLTGERTKIKTCSTKSWLSDYSMGGESNVLYHKESKVVLEENIPTDSAGDMLSLITDAERERVKTDAVILDPKRANPNEITGKIDYSIVIADELEKDEGKHFLGVRLIIRPRIDRGKMVMKVTHGDLESCEKCQGILRAWLEQPTHH